MKEYNLILVYDHTGEKILFCYRIKDPYKGMYNFVGGKIESGEDGFHAAYRELYEETGIGRDDIELHHLMDFDYYLPPIRMEVYVGTLNKDKVLVEEKNPLHWLERTEDFFDVEKFAGDGNIGHIVRCAERYGFGAKEEYQ